MSGLSIKAYCDRSGYSHIARRKSLVSSVAGETAMLVHPMKFEDMHAFGTKRERHKMWFDHYVLQPEAETSAINTSPTATHRVEGAHKARMHWQAGSICGVMVDGLTMLRRGLHVFGAPKQSITQRLDFLLGESSSHLCFDSDQLHVRSSEDFGSFAR